MLTGFSEIWYATNLFAIMIIWRPGLSTIHDMKLEIQRLTIESERLTTEMGMIENRGGAQPERREYTPIPDSHL